MIRTLQISVLVAALAMPGAGYAQGGVGTQIAIANASNTCVNVDKNRVNAWIMSIHLEKRDNWLTQTNAVGAQVNVGLFSTEAGLRAFPMAKEISTRGIDGKVVRANLSFNVLSDYAFDGTNKTSRLDLPVVLLRTKGDSAVARYSKALLQFTKDASALIPANPYASGVQLTGQLASAFFDAAASADESEAVMPNFQISHSLSRRDQCNGKDLLDGVQAQISDASSNGIADVIPTSEVNAYCFYVIGSTGDPEIAYLKKPTGGVCAKTTPATGLRTLRNPQVIYAVWAIPKSQVKKVQAGLAAERIRSMTGSTSMGVKALMTNPSRDRRLSTPAVDRALATCDAIGIDVDQCLASTKNSR